MAGLFKWRSRSADPVETVEVSSPAPVEEPAAASKVLPRLLAALGRQSNPFILDLGPVVGDNIAFFGEQLACKIRVEDLFEDIERCARAGTRDALAQRLLARVPETPATVDAVLCWDVFDYLDRPTQQALASRLIHILRPAGVIYVFFGARSGELTAYTRYIVAGPDVLRTRSYPATPTQRQVLVPRDVERLFQGLKMTESVLLKSNTRETIFRKP